MIPIDISRFEQLKASGDLPSPKGVALAIVRTTQREDVSIAELAQLIKTDPAFVGRLIKAANGVNALGRRPVASVHDALMMLGLPAVRGMALGFSLVSSYGKGACRGFNYQDFWSGSLAMSIAMQAITARSRVAVVEEAFCAGLLARIGELALATLFPAEYSNVLSDWQRQPQQSLVDLERREFVMDHAELSAAMMSDWGLPKAFFEPVYFHENPDAAGFPEGSRPMVLTRSLALARQIALVCMADAGKRPTLMPALISLGESLNLVDVELTSLCDKVAADWHEWGLTLNVHTRNLPPFEEMFKAPVVTLPPAPLTEPGAPAAVADIAAPPQKRLRTLVVDDDLVMRGRLRAMLEKAGHQVFDAANGQQGLSAALEVQPHIMIVDWLMPEMDGLALTRALRQTKAGRAIYILILTSLEDDDRLVEAFENGVDDYLQKPLKEKILAARLRAAQRLVTMQEAMDRDREEIRHFAAELAVSSRRLQEAALTDPLTGLPNRRYALDRVAQEWAGAARSGRPLSCLLVDLDQFKQINDQYGQDVGDTVLRHCAAALKRVLRPEDVLCRLGGDQFLIICPDAGLEQVAPWAERMRRTVEGLPVNIGRLQIKLNITLGAAQREAATSGPEDLVKRADRSLYLAKQRLRSRVGSA